MSICSDCMSTIPAYSAHCTYCGTPGQRSSIDSLIHANKQAKWRILFYCIAVFLLICGLLYGFDVATPLFTHHNQISGHAITQFGSGQNEVAFLDYAFNPTG